jgi:hypothetical protein
LRIGREEFDDRLEVECGLIVVDRGALRAEAALPGLLGHPLLWFFILFQ